MPPFSPGIGNTARSSRPSPASEARILVTAVEFHRMAEVLPCTNSWTMSGFVVSTVRDAAVDQAFWKALNRSSPVTAFFEDKPPRHWPSLSMAASPPASQTNCRPANQCWPGR